MMLQHDRSVAIDRARGLAIVLMVLDHSLVLVQHHSPTVLAPVYALRMTVTRASLPLFALCSGVLLHRGPSGRRLLQIASVAAVVNAGLVAVPIGIRPPEILAVWTLVVVCCAGLVRRSPVLAVVLGALQVSVWPIGWHGYQPGLVLLLLAAGFMAGRPCVGWADALPAWLGAVGSRPLAWYVGHLAVLVFVELML